MKPIPHDTTQVVRLGMERACKDFSERVATLGFARTKKTFWTRRHPYTADFIHFHRGGSTYGKPLNYSVSIRVHFSIRVLNDTFEGCALNGVSSDRVWTGRYHLRFNAQTWSTYERCVTDLVRFVVEEGEPWFIRFRDAKSLLTYDDSPLRDIEKERLYAALDGRSDAEAVKQSLWLLGIKEE